MGLAWNGRQNTSHIGNLSVLGLNLPAHNTTRANVQAEENDWNQWATRVEIDVQGRLSENVTLYTKLRGYAENPQDDFLRHYDYFGNASIANGVDHPETALFGLGARRVFRNTPLDGGYGSALENNGQDYMLDIPALYLDYNKGPLWLRVGNQQIAWGEHCSSVYLMLCRAWIATSQFPWRCSREYSDSRIPSLAIRGSYRFANDWELEGYAQRFRPTILPRPGTPYNVVAEALVFEEPGLSRMKTTLMLASAFRPME